MTGKSVRASSIPSVDIQVDEMRALPAPGCSERPPPPPEDGSFSGEFGNNGMFGYQGGHGYSSPFSFMRAIRISASVGVLS